MNAKPTFLFLTIRNQLAFGPRVLHALLEREGYAVKSLFVGDHFLDPRPVTAEQIEIIAAYVALERPTVFAISLTSYAYQDAIAVSRAVRAVAPDTLILWGGHHPTIAAEECVDHCDFVCRGEGEGALLDVARALEGAPCARTPVVKARLSEIQNLALKDRGFYRQNPIRAQSQDLDSIPNPDFSNRNKLYLYGSDLCEVDAPYDDAAIYYLMTSRGCPYKCSFCCISYMKDMYDQTDSGPYLRRRSVESVISELEEAKRNHPSLAFVYFFDDVFIFNVRWLREFAEQYKRRIGLPFWCYGYVNTTKEEMLVVLKEAGLHSMSMGIQSGSERVRNDLYLRPESDANVVRAAKLVAKHRIRVTYDLICGPFETREDKERAFELFFQLPKPFSFHFHPLSYYRNLGITKHALDRGIITDSEIVGDLQKLTQSITDYETFVSTDLVINDPHFRLLKLFGRRHIPNALIRLLTRANRRTVEALIRAHDTIMPSRFRLFQLERQPTLDGAETTSESRRPVRRGWLSGAPQVPV